MYLQLSTVSQKVASAAANLLDSSLGLCLYTSERVGHLFQSSIMLRWAPLLDRLCLWDQELYVLPGLPAFLQAASKLSQILVVCNSAMDAAQLGGLLHVCRAEQVETKGAFVPTHFPPEMSGLHVTFDNTVNGDPLTEFDPQMPAILMYHLLHQPSLTSLCLDMLQHCKFELACRVVLPELQISLRFCLQADSDIDLSWLHHQPCSVTLEITIMTSHRDANQKLIEQLQSVSFMRLHMYLKTLLSEEVRLLWKQFQSRRPAALFSHLQFPSVGGAVPA